MSLCLAQYGGGGPPVVVVESVSDGALLYSPVARDPHFPVRSSFSFHAPAGGRRDNGSRRFGIAAVAAAAAAANLADVIRHSV
jgi:hypothetical protein